MDVDAHTLPWCIIFQHKWYSMCIKSQLEGRKKGFFFPVPLKKDKKTGSYKWFDKKRQTKWHHIVVYCIRPDSHFPSRIKIVEPSQL